MWNASTVSSAIVRRFHRLFVNEGNLAFCFFGGKGMLVVRSCCSVRNYAIGEKKVEF